MADFTQSTNVKSAVRKLAEPIADISAFNAMIQSVILNNPFGCVSYMSSGASHPPVEKIKGGLHGKDRVPGRGCEDRRQGSRHLQLDRRVQHRHRRNHRQHRKHHGPRRHAGPQLGRRQLLGDPQVPRPQRRVVLRELLPAAGHHLVLRGRRHPDPDRDLGRQRPGAGTETGGDHGHRTHHHRGIPRHWPRSPT